MSRELEIKSPKRSKPTYAYSIISISIILFLLGGLLAGLHFAKKYLDNFREKIEFELVLKEYIAPADKVLLKNKLKDATYISSYRYLSKEEAAKNFEQELGENFIELLGFNPLYDSYILRLKASSTQLDSIEQIKSQLTKLESVEELNYDMNVVSIINSRFKTVLIVFITICLFFFFDSIYSY